MKTKASSDRAEFLLSRSLRAAVAFAGAAACLLVLFGCNARSGDAAEEDSAPAEAGFVGTRGTSASEQDSTPMVLRRVWGGSDVDLLGASVSADGRYLTFLDWLSGEVMVREVATGRSERVTHEGSWEPYAGAQSAAISPDGRKVAYLWYQHGAPIPFELRVIERGERESRLLFRSEDCGYLLPLAWLPGREEVLFTCFRNNGAQAVMQLSVPERSSRVIKEMDPSEYPLGPSGFFLDRGPAVSPNGRYVAYSSPKTAESDVSDIMVLDLETARTQPLVRHPANDFALGWSPDGRYVLFASDRSGTLGAWLQPVDHGRAAGEPVLIKPELWRVVPIGFTEDGAFFYGQNLESNKLYTMTLDLESNRVLATPTLVSGDHIAHEISPDWSPDGRYLAYVTYHRAAVGLRLSRPFLVIKDLETGDTREIKPETTVGRIRWHPSGRHLLAIGEEGVFMVSMETGETELVPAFEGVAMRRVVGWSPDGAHFFYEGGSGQRDPGIYALHVETGEEALLHADDVNRYPALSPDGRYIAFAAEDSGEPALVVVPGTGGDPRVVARFGGSDPAPDISEIRGMAWSSDGNAILYLRVDEAGRGLWKVSAKGGDPDRIELPAGWPHELISARELRIHPDGQRLVFNMVRGHSEVWIMEKFLPEAGR